MVNMNQETVCILCGNSEEDNLVDHHTISRCINPGWLKTIPLCLRCHRLVHKYVIRDTTELLKQLKDNMLRDYYLFNSEEIEDFGYPVENLHMKIVKILVDNIPKKNSILSEKISVRKITKDSGLSESDLEVPSHKDYQRMGFVLRDLRIRTVRERDGKYVHYDEKTIDRLRVLDRNITKLKKFKEDF